MRRIDFILVSYSSNPFPPLKDGGSIEALNDGFAACFEELGFPR